MKKLALSGILATCLIAGVAFAQTYYPTTYTSGPCLSITSYLSVGSRGSQVLSLQQFLVSQNYPGGGAWMETGYYGTATQAAVRDFQQAQGLPQTGVVDASTMSALSRVTCGTSYVSPSQSVYYPTYPTYPTQPTYPTYPYTSGAPVITSLSQNTGTAGNSVTIYGTNFDPSYNTVYFDGTALSGTPSYNGTSITFTIPYISSYANNQIVELYVTDSRGTSNSLSFTLNPFVCGSYYGGSYNSCGCTGTYSYPYTTNCGTCGYSYSTSPYNSGCGANTGVPTISYLSPQSGAVGTSVTVYGSGLSTSGNTVEFGTGIITNLQSPDGRSVSFIVPSQLTGYGSQPIVVGTYNVSIENSSGVVSNAVPFYVTSTLAGNAAPSITSVSGPSSLQTGVTGTWSVVVNNPNGSYATVSVAWGDTGYGYVNQAAPQTIYNGTQTLTFSHAYAAAGTYTVTFTITNQNGQSNTATETITVSGNGTNYGGVPAISYLSPSSGYVGAQVTIYGTNFAPTGNTINFGSGAIQNVSSNGNTITFTVPSSVGPYCAPGYACAQYLIQVTPGAYNVSVLDQYGTSNTVSFYVE